MKLLPNKKQWIKWSLPSKLTVLGFYFSIIIVLISFISYLTVKSKEYLVKKIEVDEVIVSLEVINELTNKNFNDIEESEIKIRYPEINSFLPNDFISYINSEIKENALSYLNENIKIYDFNYLEGIVQSNLISLLCNQYYYYLSAANGNGAYISININPISNKTIEFFDIFDARRNALSEIKSLLKKKSECEFFENFEKQSYIPRFYIKYESIVFIFSEYEVTPGYCGNFKIEIEYPKIVNLIRSDGPLGFLVSPTDNWKSEEHFERGIKESMEHYLKKQE